MLIKTYGAAVQGIDAIVVTIEAVAEPGVSFNLVGMADTAVKESYQRVISALTQSGYKWPRRRMVVNLSPADVRKEGAAYDLPIAIGVLASCEQITPSVPLESFMIMGELSLDGSLLPIKGVLPMAIKARELGFKGMIVPVANVTEGAVVNNLEVSTACHRSARWSISSQAAAKPSRSASIPARNLPAPHRFLTAISLKSKGRRE